MRLSLLNYSTKMLRLPMTGLIACLVVSPGAFAETLVKRYTGHAYDLNTNELLYTEDQQETYADDLITSSTVSYHLADGETIATKRIDFSADRFMPDFQLDDTRIGYMEGAKKQDGEVSIFRRRTKDATLDENRSVIPQPAVADAGFNVFIKDNWDKLMEGSPIEFNFIVPSRREYYRFRAHKIADTDYEQRRAVTIQLELANPLLSLVGDPVKLTYDVETKHLVEYRGMSNIRGTNGKNYLTRIVYPLNEISTTGTN